MSSPSTVTLCTSLKFIPSEIIAYDFFRTCSLPSATESQTTSNLGIKRKKREPSVISNRNKNTSKHAIKNSNIKKDRSSIIQKRESMLPNIYQPFFQYHLPSDVLYNQQNRFFPKTSMLPDIYPPHFKYQLPPDAVLNKPLIIPQPNIITPDETQSMDLKDSSTSSSPSLTESLRCVFNTKDLRHVLEIEKIKYRLYDYHLDALAIVLNLQVNYLRDLVERILQMNPNVLRKLSSSLNKPFVPDHDLFERDTPTSNFSSDNEVIPSSQKEDSVKK